MAAQVTDTQDLAGEGESLADSLPASVFLRRREEVEALLDPAEKHLLLLLALELLVEEGRGAALVGRERVGNRFFGHGV